MKLLMIFILVSLPIISIAHEEIPYEEMCDLTGNDSTDILTDAFSYSGGRFISSSGVVKALVVFAKMQDDSSTRSNGWPLGQDPSWYQNYIDSTTSSDGTFTSTNLSHYFYEMSDGQFKLIGDVYPHIYTSQHPQNYYNSVKDVNEEILTAIDDSVDFSKYDNWTRTNNFGLYSFQNVPDGKVDMIMIIYRELDRDLLRPTGNANLYLNDNISTNDNVVIEKGYPGSGLQQKSAIYGFNYSKYITAHEFGHYLFGYGHLGDVARLCLMHTGNVAWNAMRAMCSWERERLNWINYNVIENVDSVTISLDDFVTTGDMAKINTNSANEYFLLENHQKISSHDQPGDKGLYILHVKNGYYSMAQIDIECADGKWNFVYNSTTDTLIRDIPNINGKDELSYYSYHSGNKIICTKPWYYENAIWGDDEDAFNTDFYPIFSPWSNPSCSNSSNTQFSVRVLDETDGVVTLNINLSDPLSHPPTKPLNYEVSWNNGHPHLTWEQNIEPDFAYYEIWKKKIGFHGVYDTTSNNFFTDIYEDSVTSGNGQPVTYAVRAVDSTTLKSILTEYKTTLVQKNLFKGQDFSENGKDKNILNSYQLFNNYPNPFNPSTTIPFNIPELSNVTFEIFNVLGEKVLTVETSSYNAGQHSIFLNASNLSSGIYFCLFKAKSLETTKKYSKIQRMLLLK